MKMVLIDDNAEDRADLRRMLLQGSPRRFRFVEAETGHGGVSACQETGRPPDCILLDYHLPDMNAIEVLEDLRGSCEAVPYPVVVLTGSSEFELGRKVIQAGAQDFTCKAGSTPHSRLRTPSIVSPC